mgnify:CR=1 FL=1
MHSLMLHRKMVKLINKTTGTPMWVADERKDEYIEAGHALASDTPGAKEPEEKPVEVKKKTTAKATTAKKATTTKKR